MDESGNYAFDVDEGFTLNRFRADVFGKGSADDLEYDKETGIDEANATAEQIMEYLMGKDNFGISSKYDGDLAYRIVVVRYAMLGNRFARYKEVKIATDVSDKTVAYVNEHMDTLSGISVNEDMIRKYNYSEYFSSIIGYTGPISESEYTALHKKNKDYTQNDTVGKAGLEQYYETYLRGKNGGTILNRDGKLRKLSLKNDSMISAAVYGDFHPSGRYAVFSSNIIIPAFHAQGSKRLEVYDTESDLAIADFEQNRMILSPLTRDKKVLETFPTFSADGKHIYYCSAPQTTLPDSICQLRYSLCRIGFDQENGSWGKQADTLWNAREQQGSVCFPKASPDGKYLLFTIADYGTFPIWHRETDLYILNLSTETIHECSAANSDRSDTYHSWSSNSHWFVFASKRGDGQYGKPYFAYIDKEGKIYKPFVLPQQDPAHYFHTFKSYNIPELSKSPLPFDAVDIKEIYLNSPAEPFK